MKNRIIFAVMAAVVGIGSYAIGTTQAKTVIETQTVTEVEIVTEVQTITEIQEVEKEKIVEVIPDKYINTQSEEFINNYIDMRKVTECVINNGDLQLYLEDGNNYNWNGSLEVYTKPEIQTVIEIKEIIPDNYINTTSYDFYNNYIDMRKVVDFAATENGLYLYTQDGNGYYWER